MRSGTAFRYSFVESCDVGDFGDVVIGSLAAAKLIVDKTGRTCVEQTDGSSRTPLILATVGGHGEVVNYLLSAGGKCHMLCYYNNKLSYAETAV